jgi:hypothetical protein
MEFVFELLPLIIVNQNMICTSNFLSYFASVYVREPQAILFTFTTPYNFVILIYCESNQLPGQK